MAISKKIFLKSGLTRFFATLILPTVLFSELYAEEEIDIVDLKAVAKQNKKKQPHFDFSTMLIPLTHEALIGSPYGIRDHRLHRGVDVNAINDEPVLAALPGKVIISAYNKGGYGHYVLLEHANGLQTLYGHLSKRSVNVNDEVFPGDIVGLAGNTGRSSSAHLHFEIRYGDINIDPTTVIDFPRWKLHDNVDIYPKSKAIKAHKKIQTRLKKENVYVVKKGDTVKDVAKWFNISEDAVYRLNKLDPKKPLRAGKKLRGCQ